MIADLMSKKERDTAIEIINKTCEKAAEGLVKTLQEKFDGCCCFSRIFNSVIHIRIDIEQSYPRLAEIQKHCVELEETISYPEIQITVKVIDSAA